MIAFDAAICEYEDRYEDNAIEYRDASETWQTDGTPQFTSMSPALQARDPPSISWEELLRIGRWKVQSKRLDHRFEELEPDNVRERTAAAFQAAEEDSPTHALEELLELYGVGVPVASAILAIFDPEQYAVIDFRAVRALGYVFSELTDVDQYGKYVEFMDHFRSYNKRPETYAFYLDHVRQIAQQEGLTARAVDMALWVFDETNQDAADPRFTTDKSD